MIDPNMDLDRDTVTDAIVKAAGSDLVMLRDMLGMAVLLMSTADRRVLISYVDTRSAPRMIASHPDGVLVPNVLRYNPNKI